MARLVIKDDCVALEKFEMLTIYCHGRVRICCHEVEGLSDLGVGSPSLPRRFLPLPTECRGCVTSCVAVEDGKCCGLFFAQRMTDVIYVQICEALASAKSDPDVCSRVRVDHGMELADENDNIRIHSAYQTGNQAGESLSWCPPLRSYMAVLALPH